MNRFVFGPVPSRRLGLSLGIDLTPAKTCTLDCRYCQLSATDHQVAERGLFCDPAEVMAELRHALSEVAPPDWITFSGTGEPTLHAGLGQLLLEIRNLGVAPTCVITNGTLLDHEEVRAALQLADRILPTLTTANPATYRRIHRPLPGLDLGRILDGLRTFCHSYQGIVDLEIFVCPGLNDTPEEIAALREFILTLERLTSIYLNTAVRPPLDGTILAATPERLAWFKEALALPVPTTTAFDHNPLPRMGNESTLPAPERILALLLRHPSSLEQMERVLNLPEGILRKTLEDLEKQGRITLSEDGFWRLP